MDRDESFEAPGRRGEGFEAEACRYVGQDPPVRRVPPVRGAAGGAASDDAPGGNTRQEGPGDPYAVGPEPPEREPVGFYPMTGAGLLIFQVTTARGAIPLEGALVTVRDHDGPGTTQRGLPAGQSPAGEGGSSGSGVCGGADGVGARALDREADRIGADALPGGRMVRAVMMSGRDGKTTILSLPAPDRTHSLEPEGPDAPLPYARYDAEVLLDGYYLQEYKRIPIFDGVTSVQGVELIPLPAGGTPGREVPGETVVVEGQNPDL